MTGKGRGVLSSEPPFVGSSGQYHPPDALRMFREATTAPNHRPTEISSDIVTTKPDRGTARAYTDLPQGVSRVDLSRAYRPPVNQFETTAASSSVAVRGRWGSCRRWRLAFGGASPVVFSAVFSLLCSPVRWSVSNTRSASFR